MIRQTQPSDTLTTPDGRGLHCRYRGVDDADVVFVVVHGLGEHSGCYDDFVKRINERGWAVFLYDQHGHGKSPGRRGDAPTFDTFVDDISVAVDAARRRWPNAEPILLGHSMGGHFVLKYLLALNAGRPAGAGKAEQTDEVEQDQAAAVRRAIVSNPMILPPNPPTKAQAFAAWLTAKVIPRFRFSAAIEPTELTHDVEAMQALRRDPLIHDQLSIRIGGQLLSDGHWLIEHANELSCRVLMLIGSEDELCDRAASDKFAELAGESCTQKVLSGCRHSLLLEDDRDKVYESITSWVATGDHHRADSNPQQNVA